MRLRALDELPLPDLLAHALLLDEVVMHPVLLGAATLQRPGCPGGVGDREAELPRKLREKPLDQRALAGPARPGQDHDGFPILDCSFLRALLLVLADPGSRV